MTVKPSKGIYKRMYIHSRNKTPLRPQVSGCEKIRKENDRNKISSWFPANLESRCQFHGKKHWLVWVDLHPICTDMVARADLTAYLGPPICDIPLEAMCGDVCRSGDGHDANIFFKIMGFPAYIWVMIIVWSIWIGQVWSGVSRSCTVGTVDSRSVDGVGSLSEHEGNAFFRDEI